MMPNVPEIARQCEMSLNDVPGLKKVAAVRDGGAIDVTYLAPAGVLVIVRCVARSTSRDHGALATMMTEGDFVWAGLVYGKREGSETVGLIEAFHVSELDRLVGRLVQLREVLR